MQIEPYEVNIRFSDCDMMGHVNNAVYFTYFEEARIHYLGQLFGPERDWKVNGTIVRTNEIEYLAPILNKEKPTIEIYIESIGNKSFTVCYEVRVGNELRSIGKSVMVWYNGTTHQSFVPPEESKKLLEQLKRY